MIVQLKKGCALANISSRSAPPPSHSGTDTHFVFLGSTGIIVVCGLQDWSELSNAQVSDVTKLLPDTDEPINLR